MHHNWNTPPTNSKISDADSSSLALEIGTGGGGGGEVNGGAASEDPAAMPRPVSGFQQEQLDKSNSGESMQRPISLAVDGELPEDGCPVGEAPAATGGRGA